MKQVGFSNRDTGDLVAPRVMVADSFLERARGLMGRKPLADLEALWIHPCGSVHTCFMRFSIDLLFLDRQLRITDKRSQVKPFRLALGPSGSHSVLELPAGRLTQLKCEVGQQLAIVDGMGATMVIDYEIEILTGESAGQRLRMDRRRISIGRHPQQNDLVLSHPTISSRHASITYSQGLYLLEDLGSTNKTYVNERPLTPGETIALHDGMSFRLGQLKLRFHEDLHAQDTATAPQAAKPTKVAALQAAVALGDRLKARVGLRLPTDRHRRWMLGAGLLVGLLLCLSVVKLLLGGGSKSPQAVSADLVQDRSQVPIPLPAADVYGFTPQRDQSHPDKAIFEFEADTTRVVLVYTPGGINDAAEVQIRFNGESLGSVAVAEEWGAEQALKLPRRLVAKGQTNRIEFDHLRNPPGKENWAVRNVSVQLLPEIACNTKEGARLLALGNQRYQEKAVDEGNLFQAMRYFERAVEVGETCEPQPGFYGAAQKQLTRSRTELETAYNDLLFAYKKALKLKDYPQTKTHLEAITRLIADRKDLRFKKAQRLLTRLNQALARQKS
jgi:uncharacterized membrane protein (UPF0127 family)